MAFVSRADHFLQRDNSSVVVYKGKSMIDMAVVP